jgi:Rrf2 family iron-sulfur cluster assembly transcriptional regulator
MAMVDLAMFSTKDGLGVVSLTTIAERQNLPLHYLEQLFLKLKKAELVQSTRGAQGGYQLARDIHNITVQDIVRAVDKELKATRCENDDHGCQPNGQKCVTHDLWAELSYLMDAFLSAVTLAHICHGELHGVGRFGFTNMMKNRSSLEALMRKSA